MTQDSEAEDEPASGRRFVMRLPGFVADREVGLGDAVKRVGYALGIAPCGGCERRAAALNRWVAFTGRRR
jgi:hypothetical protein